MNTNGIMNTSVFTVITPKRTKTMKRPENKPVVARMPKALVKQLDVAGKKAGRSRSAEIVARLRQSFLDAVPTVAPVVAAVAAGAQSAVGPQVADAPAGKQVKALREVAHAR